MPARLQSNRTTLVDGPADAALTVILAHGAGAPMDSPFLERAAAALAERGWRVRRFEFPYMAERRKSGRKRPPDRTATLLESFRRQIAEEKDRRLVLAGKSMGGRMASLLAGEAKAAGWLCFGYPFHPPGRPEKTRTEHLAALSVPSLILQGTRDPFGGREEVAGYGLAPAIRLHWIEDGNHDLAPRKSSGRSQEAAFAEAIEAADAFLRGLTR
jgi:predicted alpha/beta-hydrolase family hydrolase